MKKICTIVILLVAFLSGNFSFGQVTKAEAIYKVKIDRQDKNRSKTKPSRRVEMILKEVENISLQLLYNNGKATFKAEEVLDLDYTAKLNRNSAKTISGVRNSYYYNIKEKEVISDHEIEGTPYNVVYKFDHYSWELQNETKKIDKYLCYKATTTYSYKNRKGTITNLNVTAWYTPEIPLPLGPKNYTGLPGLVLELHEGNITIYVTELTLNPEKKIKLYTPQEGKKVTEKEFAKIAAKAYGNFMDSMKNE